MAASALPPRRVRLVALLMLLVVCCHALWAPAAALAQANPVVVPDTGTHGSVTDDYTLKPGTAAKFDDPAISALPAADGKIAWHDGLPWDSNYGAFNSTMSEATEGTCALDKDGAKVLGELTEALRSDQANIDKAKGADKKALKSFSYYYHERLNQGTGTENGAGEIKNIAALKEYARYLPGGGARPQRSLARSRRRP